MKKTSYLERPLIRYSMFCLGGFFVGVIFSGCETPYAISTAGSQNDLTVNGGPVSGGGVDQPGGSSGGGTSSAPTSGPVTSTPVTLASGTPTAAPSCGPFSTKQALYVLSGSTLSMSGQGDVQGDAVVYNGSQVVLSGQATISGNLFFNVTPTDTLTLSGQAAIGGNVEANNLNESGFTSLSNSLAGLPATASLNSLVLAGTQSQIFNRSAKTNVIKISGDMNLSGQSVLTLNGGATDVFVIDINGSILISGQAEIQLVGGLLPQNVVFNNIGAGNSMSLTGQGDVAGTFLSVQRGVTFSGQGALTGSVVGKGSVSISGQGSAALTAAPFCAAGMIL